MATFFERITQLYEEARDENYKVGRKAFAAQLDVSIGKVNGWLNGSGRPDPEMLKHIAKIKNVTTSWLVGETDHKTAFTPPNTQLLPDEAQDEYKFLIEYLICKYQVKARKKRQSEQMKHSKENSINPK